MFFENISVCVRQVEVSPMPLWRRRCRVSCFQRLTWKICSYKCLWGWNTSTAQASYTWTSNRVCLIEQFTFLIFPIPIRTCLASTLVGNIFICQRPSTSAAGEGESEEEDDGSASAGVIYKIGINVSWNFLLKCLFVVKSDFCCFLQGIWVMWHQPTVLKLRKATAAFWPVRSCMR